MHECHNFRHVFRGTIDFARVALHITDTYSNQNKLFSVHFQEMPGFKGKRKRGLTLTLYKKPFRYRLPVRKRTKTSSSTPNFSKKVAPNRCGIPFERI
jgi:hypothetical protein